jgi:SIR2-like domain
MPGAVADFVIPETLRGRLRRRQCVAFVGAGFSMCCGMPGWAAMMKKLLEDAMDASPSPLKGDAIQACEEAIEGGSFVMAASLLRELLTPGDLDESVRRQFGLHVFQQASESDFERTTHRTQNLVRAPWAGIVTTNYDELIEYAIDQWGQCEVVKAHGDDSRLGTILANAPAGGFFFVKVHGSVSGSRIVLGTEEYDRVYLGAPQMTAFLTALMLRYHLVFIGCSLEDEVLRLRRTLCQHFQRIIPTSYAILQETPFNRSRRSWLREQALVECLFYPSEDKTHQAVDQLLALAAACAESRIQEVGASQGELSAMKPVARLREIGTVNQELLELVVSQPDHSISHEDLINLERLKTSSVGPSLVAISPEERHYRMLFLISIRLVNEGRGVDSARHFSVEDESVLRELERSRVDAKRQAASPLTVGAPPALNGSPGTPPRKKGRSRSANSRPFKQNGRSSTPT